MRDFARSRLVVMVNLSCVYHSKQKIATEDTFDVNLCNIKSRSVNLLLWNKCINGCSLNFHVRFDQLSFHFRCLTHFLLSADFTDFRGFLRNSVFYDRLVGRFTQNPTELGTNFWVLAEDYGIWSEDSAI